MKYLKLYESHTHKWKNIIEKNGKLYINIYKLAFEMEGSLNYKEDQILNDNQRKKLKEKEREYKNLIRNLMFYKVITFNSSYEENITGICADIEFNSGFGDASPNGFQFEYINIIIEDEEDRYDVGEEEVVVHLDINPDIFRDSKKYNL